jgi:hypothetical protein
MDPEELWDLGTREKKGPRKQFKERKEKMTEKGK